MQRTGLLLSLVLSIAAAWFGCSPAASRDELGQIVYEMPTVPGAEQPYELPDLSAAAEPALPDAPPAGDLPDQ